MNSAGGCADSSLESVHVSEAMCGRGEEGAGERVTRSCHLGYDGVGRLQYSDNLAMPHESDKARAVGNHNGWQPGRVNRVRQDGELCRIDKHGACVREQGRYGRDQFDGASEIEVSAEVAGFAHQAAQD